MKLSKLTLACLLVTSGLSISSAATAEVTDGIEFHGYFRSGVIFSVEDDLQRAKYPASKEQLGRMGIESDNDMSIELIKKWAFDDGKNIRIHVAVAGTGNDKALGSSVDAGGEQNGMGFGQTYVEFGGITDTGTFWAGKRDYGKDNYIFMTDFFYTQMSGLGIGVSDYEIGDTKFDFAYMSSDRNGNDVGRWGNNTNNIMNSVHVGANFGSFELHGQVKSMTDNWDIDGNEYAETGADLTAIYHMDSFLGLPGNGFSKVIGQVGKGLGSHQLLGGTLNTYNGWVAGGPGPDKMSFVDEDDVSARFFLWGGYFLDNGINLFPALQAMHNDNEDGSEDYWMSAMVRPTFPVSDNFFIATEFGTQYNHWESARGEEGSSNNAKATIAPTWVISTGQGPAPEIRLLGTYLNHAGNNNGDSDFIVGLQADMWW